MQSEGNFKFQNLLYDSGKHESETEICYIEVSCLVAGYIIFVENPLYTSLCKKLLNNKKHAVLIVELAVIIHNLWLKKCFVCVLLQQLFNNGNQAA